jgi:hypothetical protein
MAGEGREKVWACSPYPEAGCLPLMINSKNN